MKKLIGRTIVALRVTQDQSVLAIDTDAGPLYYGVEGDCCSESWWADAVGLRVLIDSPVTQVAEIPLPNPSDARGRQEVDAAYGYALTTKRGVATLVFRNSSNGYYGGWLDSPKDYEPLGYTWTSIDLESDEWSA